MSDFWVRLRSSLVLVLIAFLALHYGGAVLAAALCFTALIGLTEFQKVCGIWGSAPGYISLGGAVLCLAAGMLRPDLLLPALWLLLMALFFLLVFGYPRFTAEQCAAAFFGVVYIPVLLSFIYRIRLMDNGKVLVWLVFLTSWGSDVMAYCCGRLFGKHKLCPTLSPKKSVEGAVGAVIGTALLGLLYAFLFDMREYAWGIVLSGAVGSVLSQLGDLTASAIKRQKGIKDYGDLIPGHGGIMDRFDSVIFTSPAVYFVLCIAGIG